MLLNGELMNEFESLNRKDTGYCLCDTFWHYHIRNLQSLQWCLTLYYSTKITIERAIEETRQLEGTPLTANKYLISKVIKRRPEDFTYVINGIVDEISKTLNELYPTIERINKAEA
jgi:cytochrome b involved in lipid metabolism